MEAVFRAQDRLALGVELASCPYSWETASPQRADRAPPSADLKLSEKVLGLAGSLSLLKTWLSSGRSGLAS
jgi:hypothetical protein